jgi:hypothetical protein
MRIVLPVVFMVVISPEAIVGFRSVWSVAVASRILSYFRDVRLRRSWALLSIDREEYEMFAMRGEHCDAME